MTPTQAVINLLRSYPVQALNIQELRTRTKAQFPNGPIQFNNAREYSQVDWQKVFDATQ